MAHRKSRRITPSSAYIGAGNKTSVFSRKARAPFQDLADIYKSEVKKIDKDDFKSAFKKLSDADKKRIRDKVTSRTKKEKIQKYLALLATILITISIIWLLTFVFKLYCC